MIGEAYNTYRAQEAVAGGEIAFGPKIIGVACGEGLADREALLEADPCGGTN